MCMTVEPLRDVRNHFSDVIDRVEHEHERVTVTRNGRPVAVILSPEDLQDRGERSVELAVLADPGLSERQKQSLLDVYASFLALNAGQADDQR